MDIIVISTLITKIIFFSDTCVYLLLKVFLGMLHFGGYEGGVSEIRFIYRNILDFFDFILFFIFLQMIRDYSVL